MRLLLWHWGRRGAGPLFTARLASALAAQPGQHVALSLAAGADILRGPAPPPCAWAEPTYESALGYMAQRALSPLLRARTIGYLRALSPDLAICGMPALLDSRMRAGLVALRIPYAVVVHDAAAHPGDSLSFRMVAQQTLLRGARHVICLSGHVESALRGQGVERIVTLWHPPVEVGPVPPITKRVRPHLLYFGRLLPYKGLDLLADSLDLLGPARNFDLRICGEGPESPALSRLRRMPGVTVENRWFDDAELPGLLAWADALVLPYREASQSGVAALAIAAGRHVLATAVGGLPEQLAGLDHAHLCAPEPGAIAAGLRGLTARLAAGGDVAAAGDARSWPVMAAALLRGVQSDKI